MSELEKLKAENEKLKRELLGARATINNLRRKMGYTYFEKRPRKRRG